MVWTVLAGADNRARISIGIKNLIADFKQELDSL
jgi:hypothetical protein